MPKATLKIDNFHGGINNNDDPRDIEDNQSVDIVDMTIEQIGRFRPLGGIIAADTDSAGQKYSLAHGSIPPGTGLFRFSWDYKYIAWSR
jgi:hypothetical protein